MACVSGDGLHGEPTSKRPQLDGFPAGEDAPGQVDLRRQGYCRIFFPGTGEFAAPEIRLKGQYGTIHPDGNWTL